jgi:hypothetical protein
MARPHAEQDDVVVVVDQARDKNAAEVDACRDRGSRARPTAVNLPS